MTWLQDVAASAESDLLSIPYQMLGPAGRLLVDEIHARIAESDMRDCEDIDVRAAMA